MVIEAVIQPEGFRAFTAPAASSNFNNQGGLSFSTRLGAKKAGVGFPLPAKAGSLHPTILL